MVAVHGEVHIRADAATILAVLADLPAYPSWSAVHKRARILEVDEQGRPSRAVMTVSAAGLLDEQTLAYVWSDRGVSWSLLKASQQRAQQGRYTLHERGGECDVSYDLDITPSLPVPGLIVRRVMSRAVHAATEGLRARVEQLPPRGPASDRPVPSPGCAEPSP